MKIAFAVNGASVALDVEPDRRLIEILRDDLDIVGPKAGCGIGRCGACTVVVDGRLVSACLVLAARLPGCAVVTIEGMGDDAQPVKDALARAGAVQCGYCAAGLVTTLTWMTEHCADATTAEAELMVAGQICRCTGYGGLRRALAEVFAPRGG